MPETPKKKWIRPRAKLKATSVSKIETRPWLCPKCKLRFKKQNALILHYRSHNSRIPLPLDLAPSARDGFSLPKISKKKENVGASKKRENFLKAQAKGQKAASRVRDLKTMKQGIKAYEKALIITVIHYNPTDVFYNE